MGKVVFLGAYRLGVRLEGTTIVWNGLRHELDRNGVRDFCEAIEAAAVDGIAMSGAGFRLIPGRRTVTIVGSGMGPMILGSKDEALQFGIRLMSAALALPVCEQLGPVA